jgi:ribosomal protein L12E/L44/L45/RPP1/RPP2
MNPSKIKRIARDNIKLAEQYYRTALKRAYKGEIQKTQQQSEMNAEIQKNAGLAIEQEKQKSLAAELQVKGQLAAIESETKQKDALLQMFSSIYSKGLAVPENWKTVEAQVITSIAMPLFQQNQEAAEQTQQDEEMAESENQNNPQEEMQEQQML